MLRPTVVLAASLLAACSTNPPGTPLCYAPNGTLPGWAKNAEGRWSTTLQGADVEVDLSGSSTRIAVTVVNTSGHVVEIRMGGEGTSPDLQIGEVLQRPVVRAPGATGSDYEPYSALQPVRVESGWRAAFFLDSPLGREPSYGQYFVFTVEGQRPSGPVVRRSIPLTATHVAGEPRRR